MASPALPIINPIATAEAEETFNKHDAKGNVLRVPYKHHVRNTELPKLESKEFEIECTGNNKSLADIVFSCFGWMAVTSKPNTKVRVRAYTLGASGLEMRTPSLMPYVVNMRQQWFRGDNSQMFKPVMYKRPKSFN